MAQFSLIKTLVLIQILFQVSAELLFGFNWLNFTFNSSSDLTAYMVSLSYTKAIPTSFQVTSDDRYFIAVPRASPGIPATLSEITKDDSKVLLRPFPDWWMNNLSNPSGFKSISAFEIDLEGYFWLVDEQAKLLIKMAESGLILERFDFSNVTIDRSQIVDMALDLDRKFAYLSDMGQEALIVINLREKLSSVFLINHHSAVPDPSFWITVNGSRIFKSKQLSQGLGGIALSCDKRDLYYSPITSRDLFTISTQFLRNPGNELESKVMNLGYKNTASKGIIISEKGNMYLSDLQKSNVYFYEQMMPYPEYFLVYFLKHVIDDEHVLWPYHLTFNNKKRSLIVLANQYYNYLNNSIDFDRPEYGDYNFWIFETYVNDRSYLYRCQDVVSVHSEIDIPTWIYSLISIMSLILITLMICGYKHVRMLKKRHLTLIYNS
jgi:hypothetical protein